MDTSRTVIRKAITVSAWCVECFNLEDDAVQEAEFIYKGNSLCRDCFYKLWKEDQSE